MTIPPEEHRFKPGESGNPAGKPKGTLNRKTIFTRLLQAAAATKIAENQAAFLGDEARPLTIADQIACAMIMKAVHGDKEAAQWVYDNAMDKQADKVETTDTTLQSILDSVRKAPKELPKLPAAQGNDASAEQGETCKPLKLTPQES